MRKSTLSLTLILLLLLAAAKPLRLHVIANSDTTADQAIKLQVRDAVLETVTEQMKGVHTQSQAQQVILQSGDLLQAAAEETLKQQNANYSVHLVMGKSDFPDKTYGNVTYPAGEYEALRIILGEGQGQNWWCVMYPPLCLGDLDGSNNQPVEFVSIFSNIFE